MARDLKYTRNIGIAAHIDAGKTTTTERILFYTGKSHKIGEVHDGAATMDWMAQEQERGITITSAATTCEWNFPTVQGKVIPESKPYHFNIIDTPGHPNFLGEVVAGMRLADSVVLVIDAIEGVMLMTDKIIKHCIREKMRVIIVINKIDRLIIESRIPPEDAYLKLKHTLE